MRYSIAVFLLLCASAAAQVWPNPGPGMTPNRSSTGGPTIKTITIDHTKVGATDLANFPMLISGTFAYMKTAANGGAIQHTVAQPLYSLAVPADLKFATSSRCESELLKWEFESYDATTGAVNVWVQIPVLSHTADSVIYMCYGDATVTTWQGGAKGSAWDSNYVAVYHFPDGSTLSLKDSTTNANDGTGGGTPGATSGQIDGGIGGFNGSTAIYVDYAHPTSVNGLTKLTYEAWINPHANSSSISPLLSKASGSSSGTNFYLDQSGGSPDGTIIGQIGYLTTNATSKSTAHTYARDVWQKVAMTYDQSGDRTVHLYYNGNEVSYSTQTASVGTIRADTAYPLYAGATGATATSKYSGALDEVRVSKDARSADWIRTEYNNQSSPATFYTIAP